MTAYTPKTGARCSCKRGIQRDNCPTCEGTGMVIDFAAIHRRRNRELEVALARATRFLEGYRAMHDGLAQEANSGARCACWHCHNSRGIGTSFGSTRPEDSRRILAEGSVKA